MYMVRVRITLTVSCVYRQPVGDTYSDYAECAQVIVCVKHLTSYPVWKVQICVIHKLIGTLTACRQRSC